MFEAPSEPRHVPVVEASGVVKRYASGGGVTDLDLEVPRGTIMGLVGPSGAGKTTVVRLLLGALRPDDGRLRVLGREPLAFSPDDRQRIGYLPQRAVLYDDLSVRHNLDFVASISGVPARSRLLPTRSSRRARRRLDEVLEMVGLADRQRARLRDLSGGEQRRLALAAAIAHDPELLVLDEPTAGIDPVLRQELWDHFADLRDERRTLIVTTQYVTEAAYCDLVAVIIDGQVPYVAPPQELRRRAFGAPVLELACSRPLTPGETAELADHPAVGTLRRAGSRDRFRATVPDPDAGGRAIAEWGTSHDVAIDTSREVEPTFDDVFVELVERHRTAAEVEA